MFVLTNAELTVTVLDPAADRPRLGSRYCTGGSIWQVADKRLGDLLSGPRFPDPEPPPFHGQGAPEVFEFALGQDDASVNGEVCVVGVGSVTRTSPVSPFHVRDNPRVSAFCSWTVDTRADSLRLRTRQAFRGWLLELTRTVALSDRTVRSTTKLHNFGLLALPVRWFAHPFFAVNPDFSCCRFTPAVSVPANPGFIIDNKGYLAMRREYDWETGRFQPLVIERGARLSALQRHPRVGSVGVGGDFPLAKMPVWANRAAFSFEPYLEARLTAGESLEWSIAYAFASPGDAGLDSR